MTQEQLMQLGEVADGYSGSDITGINIYYL
jgi:hypothetical protein